MKLWSLRVPICLIASFLLLLSQGRQVRSQTTSVCIQPFLDDNGDVIVVSDCICDSSCEICGYYGEAVGGPEDCFTCPAGSVFTQLYDDLSGTCTASDGSATTSAPTTTGTTGTTSSGGTSAPTGSSSGTGGSSSTGTSTGICMMIYQVADNELNSFLRVDLSEITTSSITQSPSTTTWVYHDGLDAGDEYYTGGTLEDVYNPDGTSVSAASGTSFYLNWDHNLGNMIANTTFSTELNSDTPTVLQAFLTFALTDCVAKGSTEFFLALSSHGGGFIGFGGDNESERRRRRLRRKLIQSPAQIVSAIQGAFSSVSGAPSQLDVLGFDACLMQSMDALDDFATIAKYYLASEATEPGHGWAYNELSATTSAKDLAVEVVDTFVSSLHGGATHDNPKTLAVVDTTAFSTFRSAWDAMCSEMADILASGNDGDFHASLLRARGNTYSFLGYLDYPSIQTKSAMDIGDFFEQLFQLCGVDESSQLYTLMTNAYDAFKAMFVIAEFGPGTPTSSGMHITWVSKQEYLNDPEFYQPTIFPASGSYPLMGAPNYSRLLQFFYNTSTPLDNVGASVCTTSTLASTGAESSSDLLIGPDLFFGDTTIELRSEITRSVDYVLVEYGFDVTHLLQDEGLRRRLDEAGRRQRARNLEIDGGATPSTRRRQTTKWRYRDSSAKSRILQEDTGFDGTGDKLLIFGGNVAVEYSGSNVVATWDTTFYWIESGEDLEPVYANDYGGGLQAIPVCYFDQNHPVTSDQIANARSDEDAIAALGCEEGYLSFSVAEDSDGLLNLYVYSGNTLSEVTAAYGRSIVPILYIEASVGGVELYELVGGITSLVIPWTPESDVAVYGISDSNNLEIFKADTAFLEIYAYDEDLKVSDFSFLPYTYGEKTDGTDNPSNNTDPNPTGSDTGSDAQAASKGIRLSPLVGITTFILSTITFLYGVR